MKSRVVGNYCTPYGGSPGLVVMEGDSCAEGRVFQSQHHLLDGLFPHLFVAKI